MPRLFQAAPLQEIEVRHVNGGVLSFKHDCDVVICEIVVRSKTLEGGTLPFDATAYAFLVIALNHFVSACV